MNNTLEGINSRITKAEEWISDLEDRIQKNKENEDIIRDLWDNICILGVPEGKERENGSKKIFEEIIAEKFPNVGKEIINQVQEFHTESPRQDKPKEEHTETHHNQTDEN